MRASDRLLLIVVPAAAIATVDLSVKAAVPTDGWAYHHRSGAWVALSVALAVSMLFIALVPSRAVAVAAGVLGGGVLGNLVSARADANRVPNPLVIGGYGHVIAFNLADVFILLGNALLMTALIATAVHHRDRLAPPRAWERAVLRQLGLGS